MVSSAELNMYIQGFMWISVSLFVLIIALGLKKNRINVELLTYVDGGLVSRSGRFHVGVDQKTKTKHLKQMFSRKVIYKPSDYLFKKVSGIPFFGIKRHITFIEDGVDLKAVLPIDNDKPEISIHELDYKRWLFLREREEFLKARDKEKMANFLYIYAPILIIVMTMMFFSLTIIAQIGIMNSIPARLDAVLDALVNVAQANAETIANGGTPPG